MNLDSNPNLKNNELSDLIYRGSVKDVLKSLNDETLIFNFSNRYSIFDWGEMPDQLEGKGESLARITSLFFQLLSQNNIWQNTNSDDLNLEEIKLLEKLKTEGLPTHFLAHNQSHQIEVKKVNVVAPPYVDAKYNYSYYQKNKPVNTLVPLEIIFRFGVPQGSSLLQRTQDQYYREMIKLGKIPQYGDTFSRPIIELSTKLETTDRYLDYFVAKEISGLSDIEFANLLSLSTLIAIKIKELFTKAGFELWDGKFEFAFISGTKEQRNFMLVDTIGPDELRLMKDGVQLSKEILRQYYLDTSWYQSLLKAKSMAKELKRKDWQTICKDNLKALPPKLSKDFKLLGENLYMGLANELGEKLMNERYFNCTLTLKEVMAHLKNNQQQ